jgi:hypothetical protein
MKNILLILAIAFSSASFAQGNLQFNQVMLLDFGPISVSSVAIFSQSITVPSGKVWKVEHASVWREASGYRLTGDAPYSLYIDNICVVQQTNAATSGSKSNSFPIWLPEGTYFLKISNSSSAMTLAASLNAIEFNIIP